MRKVILVTVVIGTTTLSCWGQQASNKIPTPDQQASVESLLAKLRSNDESAKDTAFYKLRSDPIAMRSAKVRSAMLSLLDQENREAEAGVHMGEGEGYGEYFSDLLGTVESFADWNDQHQVCILVNAGASPDSPVPAEAAVRMKIAIPCLLEMSKGTNRVIAVPTLVKALAKAGDNLDPGTIETVKQLILLALHDPKEDVRYFTVDALGKFGGQDMIPALKEVATHDPSPEVQGHSIRRSAATAIVAIQKRAAQQQ